jgi:hypothetical protein
MGQHTRLFYLATSWHDSFSVLHHTHVAKRPKPFDLVLLHDAPISWGAHVGVYLGKGLILHLSKKLGVPAVEPVQQ